MRGKYPFLDSPENGRKKKYKRNESLKRMKVGHHFLLNRSWYARVRGTGGERRDVDGNHNDENTNNNIRSDRPLPAEKRHD